MLLQVSKIWLISFGLVFSHWHCVWYTQSIPVLYSLHLFTLTFPQPLLWSHLSLPLTSTSTWIYFLYITRSTVSPEDSRVKIVLLLQVVVHLSLMYLSNLCVPVWTCVRLSPGFPDDLVHCGRGVIKDQGQRPFPFPWEDEWPCLEVAAYGPGAIRVCCEPATLAALCSKAGPWEKEKYS